MPHDLTSQIVGSWRLRRYRIVGGEQERQAEGSKIDGRLVYTAVGTMVVLIKWNAGEDLPGAGAIAYSGRYSIDCSVIRHSVDIAIHPVEPETRVREATLEGGKLTLSTVLANGHRHILVWEREQQIERAKKFSAAGADDPPQVRSYLLGAPGQLEREKQRLRVQADSLFKLEWPVIASLFVAPPSHVLDIGCGNGAYTALMAERLPPARFTGLDRHSGLLEQARTNLPNADLHGGDASDTKWLSQILAATDPDLVFLRFALQHMPVDERVRVLRTLGQHRRAGRYVVLIEPDDSLIQHTPHSTALAGVIERRIEHQRRRGGDRCLGTRLGSLLEEAGFEDVQVARVELSRVAVQWNLLEDILWPIFKAWLDENSTASDRSLLDAAHAWFVEGTTDDSHDIKCPIFIAAGA